MYDMLKKLEHMMHCIDYIQRERGGVFNPHTDYFIIECVILPPQRSKQTQKIIKKKKKNNPNKIKITFYSTRAS